MRVQLSQFLDRVRIEAHDTQELLQQCADVMTQLANARDTSEQAYRRSVGEAGSSFADRWGAYDTPDPGLALFGLALREAPLDVSSCQQVLEVGCCEADWLDLAHHADPTLRLVGLDWRSGGGAGIRIRGDAMNAQLFMRETFDWVVSLSAIEHMGLSHYDHDPLHPDGDRLVMENIRTWLRPGGSLYLDVPYRPEGYRVVGTEHREYDDQALHDRLLSGLDVKWMGYSLSSPVGLVPKPSCTPSGVPYHYVAIHAQKRVES